MTQDPEQAPQHGGWEPPPAGYEEGSRWEEAVEHETRAGEDLEDNQLHAAGQTCVRCGKAIGPGDEVRRIASGGYQHEFC